MFKLAKQVIDIAFVCSDFERSVEFYRDQLGLEVVFELQVPADTAVAADLAPRQFRQVRLQAGETLIKLMDIAARLARLIPGGSTLADLHRRERARDLRRSTRQRGRVCIRTGTAGGRGLHCLRQSTGRSPDRIRTAAPRVE